MHPRRKMFKTQKLSDHIPFDIQSEIIKRLPVKSLIQFRSVSKQWKSFIDSPEFINNYHINHTNPQHHLLVGYKSDNVVPTYISIIDDNTFPQQSSPLTTPESLQLLRCLFIHSSVDGLLCFYGDVDLNSNMAVIWNPTVRKSVSIDIPRPKSGKIVVGFGLCPDSNDPKLVKVSVDDICRTWVVEVFMLSTRVWKIVYAGAPFKLCLLTWLQVFVNGVIYFHAIDSTIVMPNIIISFDLRSEKFGEVCLPERLAHTPFIDLDVAKVNESLGLLEYYKDGDMRVCGVWTRNDGANKTFSKIYTVMLGKWVFNRVLGFRNNGEVVMELKDDNNYEYRIEVYEPLSGLISGVGINGNQCRFSATSYMETLLLLNESDSAIL